MAHTIAPPATMLAYVGTPSGPELRRVPDPPGGGRPGQDIAGHVVDPAADGGGPPAGARVVAMVDFGGWAQRVTVPVARLAPLPDSVAAERAAGFGIAGLTALRALRRGDGLLGARVLVTGASGGVGTFAVQLAIAGGAEVTALTGAHRSIELEELGAHRVITSLDDADGEF